MNRRGMLRLRSFSFHIVLFSILSLTASAAVDPTAKKQTRNPTVILVDKKTNTLTLAQYDDGVYRKVKEFHTTVGKVQGDKVEEDDEKTPEGIYTFTRHLLPPSIKPKFGKMAFYMDYPNPFDEIAGSTGYDIMLHATDEPTRLKKDFDSLGCIVVKNEEIKELEDYIRVGLTPILVFNELKDEYMNPGKNPALQNFFRSWIEAWEGEKLDQYIEHYHSVFKDQKGRELSEYKTYKGLLNKNYDKIVVEPSRVQYFRHPKYSMILFEQNYQSYVNGRLALRSVGTKKLYIAEELGTLKIISETFTPKTW